MTFFKNFDWSFKSIAKVVGIVFLGIIAFALAVSLVSFAFRTVTNPVAPADYFRGATSTTEMAPYADGSGVSGKMGIMPTQAPGYSTGNTAEDFEVKTYSGTIQTRKLDETCDTIAQLKAKTYVIFEDSNKNNDSCYYRFKVEKDKAEEILKIVEALKPDMLNASIQSIKKQVEGVEDELSILNKKLKSVEETLNGAQSAYDEITQLATRQKDAPTLATIIDSKLNLIERLSTQRLEIKGQIDAYNKAKSDQLDQLNYTFFDLNVYKDLILDWKQISDSWKFEAKQMVTNINAAFQAVTINLITYLVRFAEGVVYLFLSVLLLKFVWMGVKKIWMSEFGKKRK